MEKKACIIPSIPGFGGGWIRRRTGGDTRRNGMRFNIELIDRSISVCFFLRFQQMFLARRLVWQKLPWRPARVRSLWTSVDTIPGIPSDVIMHHSQNGRDYWILGAVHTAKETKDHVLKVLLFSPSLPLSLSLHDALTLSSLSSLSLHTRPWRQWILTPSYWNSMRSTAIRLWQDFSLSLSLSLSHCLLSPLHPHPPPSLLLLL